MQKVVVTGADGFIALHLIRELLKRDIEVTAVVLPGFEEHPRILPIRDAVNLVTWDYSSPQTLHGVIPVADVIYHFAWQGVSAEQRNKLEFQLKNIDISLNVMRLAGKYKIRKFVFPGSTNEYMYSQEPISGSSKNNSNNAYGAVKIAAKTLCRQMAQENGIDFLYTVIAGIYSEDRRDNNVIFYVINSLLNGVSPELTELKQKVNYVHIDDVVNALILIGEHGINGKTYGIGSFENRPLSEYIQIIHDIIAPDIPLGIGKVPYKPGTKLPHSMVDISETEKDTGYVPSVIFRDGIRRVINKIMENNR